MLAPRDPGADAPDAKPLQVPGRGISITLEDVRFGYDPERPVLDGLSLHVPAGTSCALVGLSGSGKSTVLRLLLRFFDPSQGRVLVAGQDIR